MQKVMSASRQYKLYGFLAQGFSSLCTFLIIIVPAHFLTPDNHGVFSFIVATVQIAISISRALCGETLIVTSAELDDAQARLRCRNAISTSLYGLLAVTPLVLVASLVWGAGIWMSIAAVASGIAACLYDAVRYSLIVLRRAGSLFLSDASLTVLIVASFIAFGLGGMASPTLFLWIWAAGCVVISLVNITVHKLPLVSTHSAWNWTKKASKAGSAFAAEAIIGATSGFATMSVIGLVAGPSEISTFKSALTIFGMTSLINNYMRSVSMRELRSDDVLEPQFVRKYSIRASSLVAGIVIFFGIVLALLPDKLGSSIFASAFLPVVAVIIPAVLHRAAAAVSTIPTIILRMQGITWSATSIRFIVGIIGVASGPAGAYFGGAYGALLGDSVPYLLLSLTLFILVFKSARKDA